MAEKPFVSILWHKLNQGYGNALKSGLRRVRTPYCVTLDADGQHDLDDVEGLLKYALEVNADMVVGSREASPHVSRYRELGKWLIRRFTSFLIHLPIKDLNSGFKLYRAELVKKLLDLCPDSMAFSDVITLLFIYQRYLVVEYPITVKKRVAGRSTINTQTAIQTVLEILNLVMLINPLRIFLPLSIFCIVIGLLWGIPFVLLGRGVSVGSMLAIVLGGLFFFLGLIASQLSAIRIQLADLSKNSKDPEQ
jgi:glycosyltransferase involved in cell wall biosynthesis